MEFLVVKILDYEDKRKELDSGGNPFSIVILACLGYIKNRKTIENLYKSKHEIILQLLKSGYSKRYIRVLLRFIDWVIQLPKDLEDRLNIDIENEKEEKTMPYVTSWERRGIEKGIEKKAREDARRMLEEKCSIDFIVKITGLSVEEIKKIEAEAE